MDLLRLAKGTKYASRARGQRHRLRRGKTSGRGHKGRGALGASRRAGYEGGQMPIYRHAKRGFTNARFRTDYTIINVDLSAFEAGATVDLDRPHRSGQNTSSSRSSATGADRALRPRPEVLEERPAKIEAAGGPPGSRARPARPRRGPPSFRPSPPQPRP